MTAQDFTPGPWDALVSDFGICNGRPYVTVDNGSASICLVVTTDMSGRNLPFVANAHIIAAAPDLFEALTTILEHDDVAFGPLAKNEGVLDRARAALLKASPGGTKDAG